MKQILSFSIRAIFERKARHKVLSRLGVLKECKARKPTMKIAVAGCVAQADGQRLLKAAPQIDLLFGPGKIETLPALLEKQDSRPGPTVALGFEKASSGEISVSSVRCAGESRSGTSSPSETKFIWKK